VTLVKPAARPSTAVHSWRECLKGNSGEIRPQALSCEAVRCVDPRVISQSMVSSRASRAKGSMHQARPLTVVLATGSEPTWI
jgi:hypothetical protein